MCFRFPRQVLYLKVYGIALAYNCYMSLFIAISSEIIYTFSDEIICREVKKMNRPRYFNKIKERIYSYKKGSVFITADFLDIATTHVINKALSRLVEDKFIRRVYRGIYEYPKYNDFLKEYVAPDPQKIAAAIARNYGWSISPSGDTALNLLGLSTQVPATWSYVSDGPYKNYKIDGTKLIFKRRANRETSGLSSLTIMTIQALKTLGKNNIDNNIMQKLSKKFSTEEKKMLLRETRKGTAWIHEYIKAINEKEAAPCME